MSKNMNNTNVLKAGDTKEAEKARKVGQRTYKL